MGYGLAFTGITLVPYVVGGLGLVATGIASYAGRRIGRR